MRHVFNHVLYYLTIASTVLVPGMRVYAQHVTKIEARQLVTNGESFFAASNITSELTRLARADGFISQSERFKSIAVSGAPIANVVNQYKRSNPKPVYLISDGGGIDLMSGNCSNEECTTIRKCKNALEEYLEEMRKGGTKKLLWMIYPDPQGAMWSTLKKNQDIWAEVVPPIINACTDPKTLLVDLRETWEGHYNQYTRDGIHCTDAGGTATAEAFWKAMMDSNFFDLPVFAEPLSIAGDVPSAFLGQIIGKERILLSLSLNQPSNVTLRLMTISGRSVLAVERQTTVSGMQIVEFPLAAIASGMYCCEVRAGRLTNQSTVLIP